MAYYIEVNNRGPKKRHLEKPFAAHLIKTYKLIFSACPLEVKLEPKHEDDSNDSDDYFLADTGWFYPTVYKKGKRSTKAE